MSKHITDIKGVYANGIASGIKSNGAKDLAYIFIPNCVAAAGVFTVNQFPASSVIFSQGLIKKGIVKAVIINSGNANAGTGEKGLEDTKLMSKTTAKQLGIKPSECAVASTGKIGAFLPMDTVGAGIETLLKTPLVQNGQAAAEAILTTDLCTKETYYEEMVGKKTITIAGFSKGSGMIAPNMATTLSFLATNVQIKKPDLQRVLKEAVHDSFNMLSVDTDTSTNDMLLLFSVKETKTELHTEEEWRVFKKLLLMACIDLAKKIARDGEGATKLITVTILNAANTRDARKMAMNVVNSPLVKTALHGADPNWGRIVAAACRDPQLKVNPQKIELALDGHTIFSKGAPAVFDREAVVSYLKQENIDIVLNLNLGKSTATGWGCDLTKGYIDINVQYC